MEINFGLVVPIAIIALAIIIILALVIAKHHQTELIS